MIREQARRLKGPPLGRFDGGDDPKDVVRPLVVPEDGSARIGSLTRLRHDARRHALPSERRQEGQRGRTPKWGREVSPPRRGGRWPGPWQKGEAFLDGRVREVRSGGIVCLWRVLGHDLTGRAAVAEVQG